MVVDQKPYTGISRNFFNVIPIIYQSKGKDGGKNAHKKVFKLNDVKDTTAPPWVLRFLQKDWKLKWMRLVSNHTFLK